MDFIKKHLNQLVYPEKRLQFLTDLKKDMQEFGQSNSVHYEELTIPNYSEQIPLIFSEKLDPKGPLLVLLGAQHNEYNGTVGIWSFIKSKEESLLFQWQERYKGGFCIIPLVNVRGFLDPNKDNKWGYYVPGDKSIVIPQRVTFSEAENLQHNRVNLNRFWHKVIDWATFNTESESIPAETQLIGKRLLELRHADRFPFSPVIILDFHETSLIYKYYHDLAQNFSPHYLLNHWVKRWLLNSAISHLNLPMNLEFSQANISLIRKELDLIMKDALEKSAYFISYGLGAENLVQYLEQEINQKFESNLLYTNKRSFLQQFSCGQFYFSGE